MKDLGAIAQVLSEGGVKRVTDKSHLLTQGETPSRTDLASEEGQLVFRGADVDRAGGFFKVHDKGVGDVMKCSRGAIALTISRMLGKV